MRGFSCKQFTSVGKGIFDKCCFVFFTFGQQKYNVCLKGPRLTQTHNFVINQVKLFFNVLINQSKLMLCPMN